MSSSFAALMALSESQTKESKKMVQSALADRQRKEAQKRKEQEERERREREAEAELRKRRLEREREEEERRRRTEEEKQARERLAQRREEEKRNALLFGPKKASSSSRKSYPSRSRGNSRSPSPTGAQVLTREEKRERRWHAEMYRNDHSGKRASGSFGGGYMRAPKRFAGGAVDSVTVPGSASSANGAASGLSARARLAAMPSTLTKLNVVKRDMRTIDEIHKDVKEKLGKVTTSTLDGDEARIFSNWFGKKDSPSKLTSKMASPDTSGTNTPSAHPYSKDASPVPKPSTSAPPARKLSVPARPAVASTGTSKTGSAVPAKSFSKLSSFDTKSSTSRPSARPLSAKSSAPSLVKSASMKASSSSAAARSSQPALKKRPRTDSRSVTPPPYKKRAASREEYTDEEEEYMDEDEGGSSRNVSTMIWKMFGRDRQQYVGQDVFSDDDDDMEVGAGVLEREELMSARLARKEDQEAEAEEKRREEEKRRKKKEALSRRDSHI